MIRFIVAPGHFYTFNPISGPKALAKLPVQVWIYRDLFDAAVLPRGTWVFCDLERLAVWELRLAGEVARLMREAGDGVRVLNDPARAASRYELLHRLHGQGFNQFRAWRAEDGIPQARFPVFLRIESDHHRPLTGLIDNQQALAAEIEVQWRKGVALRGLLIVEYRAQELAPGVFRKFGAYRIGDRIVADHLVHDVSWVAKYGTKEAWSDARYADEAAYVRDNPHRDALMQAFKIGGIEYGRADYGIVGGVPQIWEINTNPVLPSGDPSGDPPQRVGATVTARENRLAAIAALDLPNSHPLLRMNSEFLVAHRKRQKPEYREAIRD